MKKVPTFNTSLCGRKKEKSQKVLAKASSSFPSSQYRKLGIISFSKMLSELGTRTITRFFSVERETVCKFFNCFFFFSASFLFGTLEFVVFFFFFCCYQLFHLDFPSLEHTCRTYLGYNLLYTFFHKDFINFFCDINIFCLCEKWGIVYNVNFNLYLVLL